MSSIFKLWLLFYLNFRFDFHESVFGGMACDQSPGGCAPASSLAVKLTVQVSSQLPVFRQVGTKSIQLFAAVGVPLTPTKFSVPAIGDNTSVTQAYVNCPIRQIPFAFSLSGLLFPNKGSVCQPYLYSLTACAGSFEILSLRLISPPPGTGYALEGASLSPASLYPTAAITDNGFDLTRISDYWCFLLTPALSSPPCAKVSSARSSQPVSSAFQLLQQHVLGTPNPRMRIAFESCARRSYAVLSWTPPLSAAGRRYNACVLAADKAANSAVRCRPHADQCPRQHPCSWAVTGQLCAVTDRQLCAGPRRAAGH